MGPIEHRDFSSFINSLPPSLHFFPPAQFPCSISIIVLLSSAFFWLFDSLFETRNLKNFNNTREISKFPMPGPHCRSTESVSGGRARVSVCFRKKSLGWFSQAVGLRTSPLMSPNVRLVLPASELPSLVGGNHNCEDWVPLKFLISELRRVPNPAWFSGHTSQ